MLGHTKCRYFRWWSRSTERMHSHGVTPSDGYLESERGFVHAYWQKQLANKFWWDEGLCPQEQSLVAWQFWRPTNPFRSSQWWTSCGSSGLLCEQQEDALIIASDCLFAQWGLTCKKKQTQLVEFVGFAPSILAFQNAWCRLTWTPRLWVVHQVSILMHPTVSAELPNRSQILQQSISLAPTPVLVSPCSPPWRCSLWTTKAGPKCATLMSWNCTKEVSWQQAFEDSWWGKVNSVSSTAFLLCTKPKTLDQACRW